MTDDRTEQQRKWMASIRQSLETSTGRSMADWVAVARTCPETAPRARLRWFKDSHGLGQNYASVIFGELGKAGGDDPRDPNALAAALWRDPAAAAVLARLRDAIAALPDAITGQRKGYTTWSRGYAFASARPANGKVRLGLAVPPGADPRLAPPAREGWSERLKAVLVIAGPDEVDSAVAALLKVAWEQS